VIDPETGLRTLSELIVQLKLAAAGALTFAVPVAIGDPETENVIVWSWPEPVPAQCAVPVESLPQGNPVAVSTNKVEEPAGGVVAAAEASVTICHSEPDAPQGSMVKLLLESNPMPQSAELPALRQLKRSPLAKRPMPAEAGLAVVEMNGATAPRDCQFTLDVVGVEFVFESKAYHEPPPENTTSFGA
jgi:hypothetical protein